MRNLFFAAILGLSGLGGCAAGDSADGPSNGPAFHQKEGEWDDGGLAPEGDAAADAPADAPDADPGVDPGVDPDETITPYIEAVETPPEVLEALATRFIGRAAPTIEPTEGEIDWELVINLGKEIWKVVEENAPVANIHYDYATALPPGVNDPYLLDGFSDLNAQSFRVWGVNLFGMTVYDVIYTVVHQYGGSYKGRGHYLATVSVIPSLVDVLWAYNLDLDVAKVTTLNVGTAEDPVASIALELKLKVSTVIKKHTSTTVFQFRGDSSDVRSSEY